MTSPPNITPEEMVEKRRKPARGEAWGLLNPYGDLWSYQTFETAEAANAYARHYWRSFPGKTEADAAQFKPVKVRVTVSIAKTKSAHSQLKGDSDG